MYLIQEAWVGTEFLAGEQRCMICHLETALGWSRDWINREPEQAERQAISVTQAMAPEERE